MSEIIISALIAGIISLVIALLSYFSVSKTLKQQRTDLEKKLNHNFTDKLYDLRLKHYPKAFEITECIVRKPIPHLINSNEELKAVYKELMEWKNGEVSCCLSKDSLEAFYALRKVLLKRPGHGESYTTEQAEKIFLKRKEFRGLLRNDLGSLYTEDVQG